jgi:hypothetical protein
MQSFNASLLREKFLLREIQSPADADRQGVNAQESISAVSNRFVLPLFSASGDLRENYVIRSQNMHTGLRFAASIVQHFSEKGPLFSPGQPFDWNGAFQDITKAHEQKWNPALWVSVYASGKPVFEGGSGQRHAFLDIIEQCDFGA